MLRGTVISVSMTPMAAAVEDFLIRPIRKGDVKEEESVVSLVNRCYRGTECWTTEADIVSGLRLTHEQLQASIRDFHVYVMVDTSNENIVGCVKSGVTTEPAAGSLKEPAGYMGLFAVSPDYQSRRLGSRLADFAEQKCKESGVRTMVSWAGCLERCLD